MARTTPELVKGILEVENDDLDLQPFIDDADELVTDVCTNSGYSDSKLERIARWLAAHFVCQYERRVVSEQIETVLTRYEGKVDLGLADTQYGQQAMIFDTAGNLAKLNAALLDPTKTKVKPFVYWLGKLRSRNT